jgi:deoxyribonuclease-4
VLFGAQVKQAGGFLAALKRAETIGAEAMQVFAQSPRQWKPPNHDDDVLDAFVMARKASAVVQATVCHAPYLVNLANPDPEMHDRSVRCLADNLEVAARLGAIGLVLHPGSHLGAGFEAALDPLVESLMEALDDAWSAGAACPILLENTAGAGGTIGRSFDELGAIIERAGGDRRLGVCLDTQHLWASGIAYSTPAEADALMEEVDAAVGLDRLRCLHVNDSKVPFGANRDRHENIGEGTIGAKAFRSILGHPAVQGLPAILEIPGLAGDGPAAEDLARARRLHRQGLARRP